MKININNVEVFSMFLSSLLKIVPSCKFIITPQGTKVKIKTESKSLRGVFQTDSITSEEQVEFCFGDLSKFFKSVSLIKDIEKLNQTELVFDEPFIRYKNKVTFKLKTIKEERITKLVDNIGIDKKFKTQYNIITNTEKIKKVLKCVNIVDDSDAKVYFVKTTNGMVCEIDNKCNQLSDSVGIPLCSNTNLTGEVVEVLSTTLDNFRCFGILPSENININMTTERVIVVTSAYRSPKTDSIDSFYIAMKLYSSILKG